MADQGATLPGFSVLEYHPGNPEFPTLPADPLGKQLMEYGVTQAGLDYFAHGDLDQIESPRSPSFNAAPALGGTYAADPNGDQCSGYADWYMDTVWLTPGEADFGDITNDKDVDVTIHNTRRINQSLDSADTSAIDGLSLTDPTPPENIEALSSIVVTLTATKAGPDNFDDFVSFTFSIEGLTLYRAHGQRVLFFSVIPQQGMKEQLRFRTDLMRSKDGTEQAFALRLAPTSNVSMKISFSDDEERLRASNILFGGSPSLKLGIQSWWEAQFTTAIILSSATTVPIDTTEGSWAVGDTISFVLPDRSTVEGEIDTVNPGDLEMTQEIGVELPVGTAVMPIRFGYMSSAAGLKDFAINLEEMSAKFITYDEQDLAFLDTAFFDQHPIDSLPIIKKRWMTGPSASASIFKEQSVSDGQTGVIAVRSSEALGEYKGGVMFPLKSKAEIFAYRQFLHFVKGSWGKFYMPTFQKDLPLNADYALGGNTFTINSAGVKTFLDGQTPKRDLRIVLDDGTIHYRRITTIVDNGTIETITIDSTIGSSGFSVKESTTVSWMHIVRLDGDAATFDHRHAGIADLQFNIRSVKE